MILSLLSLPHRVGRRSFLSMVSYHTWGSTPLMSGVMNESLAEVQALVELRADLSARNVRNRDVRELAVTFKSAALVEVPGF